MTKKSIILLLLVLVIIVIIAIVLSLNTNKETVPEPATTLNTPQEIANDLNGLEVTDINKEFKDIDAEIQKL
jgi:peptidoglycan hydrolase CwlO-like protein